MLTRRRMTPLALTLILAFVVGCGGSEAPPAAAGGPEGTDSTLVVLDSAQQAASELLIGPVGSLPADTIRLTGTLSFDPSRVSHVGPRIQGRIRAVRVTVGAIVQAGDTLGLLDSPELGAAQAAWAKAGAAQSVAARNFERAERLSKDGIVSERSRLETEAELRARDADLAAAVQTLTAFGAEPDSAAPGVFPLRTPLAGEVVDQHAVVGEVVGPESELFTIGDRSHLWLMLDLYDADAGRVRLGETVHVRVDALPEMDIVGRVGYIGAVVDSVSRTLMMRVEIQNRDQRLKPGMFAQASLVIPGDPRKVGIPGTAVQRLEGSTVVFAPAGPGRFRIVPVTLGPERAGGWREVVGGLQQGDTVVLSGGFALKAHLQREQFGGDE